MMTLKQIAVLGRKLSTFLALFGDHFDERPMAGRHEACVATARMVNEAGGRGEVIHLPERGIRGNTHLMMQDDNNDVIAGMILKWVAR